MRTLLAAFTLLLALALAQRGESQAIKPLSLHPENPRYLLFRGKPTILVASGERYGAVLNLDFNYPLYLEELKSQGLNLTRVFSGAYREIPGSFGIAESTLAPNAPQRFCSPWTRSATPGAGDGGNKFDLKQWNPDYFTRLKDFLAQAGQRGVVVELVLFSAIYDERLWAANPMNAANNVNGIGRVSFKEVYSLREPGLTAVQEEFVRKLAAELRDFDNVYFEICNEPYVGGVTPEWTGRIAQAIVEVEASGPRHLIAQNIASGLAKVENPLPHVSIFNFHYASPPDAVALNYGLNKALADDQTGFKGKDDFWYRREGWEFLLAGGAIYSNLDYSFTCGHPGGTLKVTKAPGGGGAELRRQLAILKGFLEGFDFIRMKPANGNIKIKHGTLRGLVEEGKAYALYVHGARQAEITLALPAGDYQAEWINTKTGGIDRTESIRHKGGTRIVVSPVYSEDVALRLRRTK